MEIHIEETKNPFWKGVVRLIHIEETKNYLWKGAVRLVRFFVAL